MPETFVSRPNKQDNATHQRTHVVMHGYNLDLAVSSGTLLLDLDLERDLDLDFHLDLGPPRGQPRVCIRRLPFSYKYRFTNVTKAHGIRNGWAPLSAMRQPRPPSWRREHRLGKKRGTDVARVATGVTGVTDASPFPGHAEHMDG